MIGAPNSVNLSCKLRVMKEVQVSEEIFFAIIIYIRPDEAYMCH